MAHDVLISYSSKYPDIAKAICHILEQEKIKCWIAPRDLDKNRGGEDYDDAILDAIKKTAVIVVIISDAALESRWVKIEVTEAWDNNKTVIPYIIDEISVDNGFKMQLKSKHWIDAYPNPEKKFMRLVDSVKNVLNQGTENKNQPYEIKEKDWDSDFDYEEGLMLYEAEEYNDAVMSLAVSAEIGNKKAANLICKIFYDMPAYYEVDDKVYALMEKHATQGLSYANFALHTRFYKGDSYLISYEYLKKAVKDKSNHYAFLRLGIHYAWGLGVNTNHIIAMQWYKRALEAGSTEVYGYLGSMYEFGNNKLEKDEAKAIELYLEGARLNDTRSLMLLGNCYANGTGLEKNIEKAIKCFEKMIELKDYRGYSQIGNLYHFDTYEQVDLEKAKDYYKKAASKNVGDAFGSLAWLYWINYNMEPEAVGFAKSGVSLKSSYAATMLGYVYENGGSEIETELSKAWEYYSMAYKWASAPTNAVSLARLFKNGYRREDISINEIISILDVASKGLDSDALAMLIEIYSGENDLIEKDEKKVFEYTRLGAEAGIIDFMAKLANMYINGEGVITNIYKGQEWLEKAAKQNNKDAIRRLRDVYKAGTEKNDSEHKRWTIRAMEEGIEDAYSDFIDYVDSLDEGDMPKAITFLNNLCDKSNPKAAYKLATCYRDGTGVISSTESALDLFYKSALWSKKCNKNDDCRFTAIRQIQLLNSDVERIKNIEDSGLSSAEDFSFYIDSFLAYPFIENEGEEFNQLIWKISNIFKEDISFPIIQKQIDDSNYSIFPKGLKDLTNAIDSIYSLYPILCKEYDSKYIDLNNVHAIDFYPFASFTTLLKLREDVVNIFLSIRNTKYEEVLPFTFSISDEKFLDQCEKATNNNLVNFMISVIEIKIELEYCIIDSWELFRAYLNDDKEKLVLKLNEVKESLSSIENNLEFNSENMDTVFDVLNKNEKNKTSKYNDDDDEEFQKLLDDFINSEIK